MPASPAATHGQILRLGFNGRGSSADREPTNLERRGFSEGLSMPTVFAFGGYLLSCLADFDSVV